MRTAGRFMSQLGYADVASATVAIRRRPEVAGEALAVVLAAGQPAGQGVVISHHPARAGRGLAGPLTAAERQARTRAARAALSAASQPWAIASVTSFCIAVSAPTAWTSQHHR